jgi:hypothetical protein
VAAGFPTGTRAEQDSSAAIVCNRVGTTRKLHRFDQGAPRMLSISHISPIVALVAGILILIFPQALNYIVAIYLIIVGITGLGIIH